MTEIKKSLMEAFHEDHAILGRGFHALRQSITAGDVDAARKIAKEIDCSCGSHIAFEEVDFYPLLKNYFSEAEVHELYQEHKEGLSLIEDIMKLDAEEMTFPEQQKSFLNRLDIIESHIDHCGDLFGFLGTLSQKQYCTLFARLKEWRKRRPAWTKLGEVLKREAS
jgi:hypothetical protein